MPSIDRPLSGDVLVLDIQQEQDKTSDPAILGRSGRNARTLFKSGALRVTLVVVGPGGDIAEHQVPVPLTIQPLEGRIRFEAPGHQRELGPGELLLAEPDVPHTVSSEEGASFLLTVVAPAAEGGADG